MAKNWRARTNVTQQIMKYHAKFFTKVRGLLMSLAFVHQMVRMAIVAISQEPRSIRTLNIFFIFKERKVGAILSIEKISDHGQIAHRSLTLQILKQPSTGTLISLTGHTFTIQPSKNAFKPFHYRVGKISKPKMR